VTDQEFSSSELLQQIDALLNKNQSLHDKITNLEASLKLKKEELTGKTLLFQPTPAPKPAPSPFPSKTNLPPEDFLNNLSPTTTVPPKPEEMYDEKMLEIMEERDNLKIQLDETVLNLEEAVKNRDVKVADLQILQLEMSGIKVENESLKSKLRKETQRADDAVALAEKAVGPNTLRSPNAGHLESRRLRPTGWRYLYFFGNLTGTFPSNRVCAQKVQTRHPSPDSDNCH